MGYIYTKSGKLAKRLYFGAVLLFEGLYYTFKNRVLADGGTFLENELPTISQDASLVLTPNAYKAGKLYSAVPNDGTGDFTVDRNYTATYIGQDGLIKTALANVPRIDWSTGEATLLVEPQQTNLIAYSENFSNAFWNKTSVTVLPGQLSPNGGTDAYKIIDNVREGEVTSNDIRSVNNLEAKTYIISIHVKAGTKDKIKFYNGATTAYVDITNKQLSGDYQEATIETLSDGWVRVSVKQTYTTSGSKLFLVGMVDVIGEGNYLPDGTGTVFFYGFQIEEGTEATSYIPTNGSTVTRLADNISVPTPAGVTAITETINGVEQTPITTIPATYSLPVGNINKVTMI